MRYRILAFVCVAIFAGSAHSRDILAIGDSVLEWQSFRGGAVPQVIARELGRDVENRAASGAKMYLSGADDNPRGVIPAQYEAGDWSWVILTGGANDLLTKCGCRRCDVVLDKLLSGDGRTGIYPDLVRRITADGAKVMVLGYYKGNARPNLFSRCRDAVLELTRRKALMAKRLKGVHFVRTSPAVDPQNRRHFALDGFHPSRLGARRIGQLVAQAITRLDE